MKRSFKSKFLQNIESQIISNTSDEENKNNWVENNTDEEKWKISSKLRGKKNN